MIFLWMLGGIIVVSLAFFLPDQSIDLWQSLDAAGIAAVIYIVALLVYILCNPIPAKHRIILGAVALLSMIGLSTHWVGMYSTTHWQQKRILENKSLVIRGIMISDAPIKLLSVLEEYQEQGKIKKLSPGKIFLKKYPQAHIGSNVYVSPMGDDSIKIFVTALSDSAIVLTASHTFAQGRTADFLPYWGRKGTIQERYILTEKGVRHESDN